MANLSFYWRFTSIPQKWDLGSFGERRGGVWAAHGLLLPWCGAHSFPGWVDTASPQLPLQSWWGISSHVLLSAPSHAGIKDFSLSPQHTSRPEIILVFCRINLSSFLHSLCAVFWSALLCLGRRLLFLICVIKSVVSLDQKFFFEQHRHRLLLKCMTLILCVCSQETKWADFSSCSVWFCQASRPYFISPRPVSILSFDRFEENSCFPQCKYGKKGAGTRHLLFIMSHSSFTVSCIKAVPRGGTVWLYILLQVGKLRHG